MLFRSSGQGELHLEVIVDRMLREFKVDATVGKPQVAYRETITQKIEKVVYRHVKQTGGSGQFAHVVIDLEPTGPGGGYEFIDKITGGRIPKEFIPSVEYGIRQTATTGVFAGNSASTGASRSSQPAASITRMIASTSAATCPTVLFMPRFRAFWCCVW